MFRNNSKKAVLSISKNNNSTTTVLDQFKFKNLIYNTPRILKARDDAYKLINKHCKRDKNGKPTQELSQVKTNSKDMADILFKDLPFVAGKTDNDDKLFVYSVARRCYTDIQPTIEFYFGLIFPNYRHHYYQDIYNQIIVNCFASNPKDHKQVDLVTYHLPYKFAVCGNGLYDRVEHKLIPNTPKHFIRSTIATPLVTKKQFDIIKNKPVYRLKYKSHHKIITKTITAKQFSDHYLDAYSNFDKLTKRQLCQVMLRCLEPGYPDKCVFLIGPACTGKSSFLNFIKALIGSSANYSSLNVTDMKSDRDLEGLDTVLCNLGDDSGDNPHVNNNQLFKSIITGDTVRIDAKFQKPYSTTIKIQFVQATNDMITFDGQSKGIARRILFIPFDHKMSNKDKDYIPNAKMQQLVHNIYVREYLLYKIIHLPRFDDFLETPRSKKLKNEFSHRDSHITDLINDFNKYDIERIPKSTMFNLFKNYCKENGFRYTNSPKFCASFITAEKGKYTEKREVLGKQQIQQIEKYVNDVGYSGYPMSSLKPKKMYRCFVRTKKGTKILAKENKDKSNHSDHSAKDNQTQNSKEKTDNQNQKSFKSSEFPKF